MTILTIARLTIREAQRRRILWIGTLMGLVFLTIFGLGFHFIYIEVAESLNPEDQQLAFSLLTIAGLYATNFLVVMIAVLTSVTTVAGEVETHTVDCLLTKPIRRWELVLGKWLGHAVIIFTYVLLMPGGVLLLVYLRAGFVLQNVASGLSLIYLEGLVALTVSIAGGTRLSTLANGALAFMLYGVAFVGGWVEQIGALLRNETAVDLGIVASLLMPTEILWKKASVLFEPRVTSGIQFAGPFGVTSQPSGAMIVYACLYVLLLLLLALWSFNRRDL